MGLAPFADKQSEQVEKFRNLILTELIELHENGSLTLNTKMFDFQKRSRMVDPQKWSLLFGIERRVPESELKKEHANLAFALQSALEEGVIRLARHALLLTGEKNLVMAGGVALNCAANGRLAREKIFDHIWIQPAAGDAGGALGAAMAYSYLVESCSRKVLPTDGMRNCALGSEFTREEIKTALEIAGLQYAELSEPELLSRTASYLNDGKIVGWFQGPAEWGPRALCRRSILARANDPEMQKRLNVAVKFRETFRPFAPVVLESESENYFKGSGRSPYMLFTYPVVEKWRKPLPETFSDLDIGEQLRTERSELPAITHMDFSARIQTVDSQSNPRMAGLLEAFKQLSGHPVLVNTSFNRRGEPIVNSPSDAIACFINTGIDVLVIGDFVVLKSNV